MVREARRTLSHQGAFGASKRWDRLYSEMGREDRPDFSVCAPWIDIGVWR